MENVMNAQKGFTLIELMIVVAIIGILAAIALPVYQDYTGRAQASEGLKATSGLQTDIAVYLTENNELPKTDDLKTAAGSKAKGIFDAANTLEGKYFVAGSVSVTNNGVIGIKFTKGANSGTGMTLTPNLSATNDQIKSWTCAGAVVDGSTALDSSRLPTSCQGS